LYDFDRRCGVTDDNILLLVLGNSLKWRFRLSKQKYIKFDVQAVNDRGDVLKAIFTITVVDDKLPTIFA
jgi:hypothetical protein